MTCEHCAHCKTAARDAQERANLYPLGTHLIHPKHGRFFYWRNDIDSSGAAGTGHFVYRPEDDERELIYVAGSDFELATLEIDIPAGLARFFAEHPYSAAVLAELGPGRRYRGGLRLTVTFRQLAELSRIVFWVREMADVPVSAQRGATRLGQKLIALPR